MKITRQALGCAIVLLVAVAPASPQNYYSSVSALTTSSESGNWISLGGYWNAADGGGGMLVQGPSTWCYYRFNPTNDVHEWGAKCDVQGITNSNTYPIVWNPTISDGAGHTGAIVVQNGAFFFATLRARYNRPSLLHFQPIS